MVHELTAFQYLEIARSLPDPNEYYKESGGGHLAAVKYTVAYIPYGESKRNTALATDGLNTPLNIEQITFEIALDGRNWFWQPTETVHILSVYQGEFKKNYISSF